MKSKKIIKKIISIIFIIVTLLFTFAFNTKATIDPENFRPGDIHITEIEPLIDIGQRIVNVISIIGIVVAILMLIILGMRYVAGSTVERARYRESMIPYLVGALLTFGITQVVKILYSAALYISGST